MPGSLPTSPMTLLARSMLMFHILRSGLVDCREGPYLKPTNLGWTLDDPCSFNALFKPPCCRKLSGCGFPRPGWYSWRWRTAPGAGLGDRRIPGRSGQRASGRMIQNSCPFGELSSAFPRHFQGTLSKGVDDPEFPAVQTLWALQAVRDQEHLALAG